MNINFDSARPPANGALTRVLGVIVGALALIAAFMFSLVIFAAVAVAGLAFWIYFWWRTRGLRQQLREQAAGQTGGGFAEPPDDRPRTGSEIIEGEAVRVVEVRDRPEK